jgi:hypothetical protein
MFSKPLGSIVHVLLLGPQHSSLDTLLRRNWDLGLVDGVSDTSLTPISFIKTENMNVKQASAQIWRGSNRKVSSEGNRERVVGTGNVNTFRLLIGFANFLVEHPNKVHAFFHLIEAASDKEDEVFAFEGTCRKRGALKCDELGLFRSHGSGGGLRHSLVANLLLRALIYHISVGNSGSTVVEGSELSLPGGFFRVQRFRLTAFISNMVFQDLRGRIVGVISRSRKLVDPTPVFAVASSSEDGELGGNSDRLGSRFGGEVESEAGTDLGYVILLFLILELGHCDHLNLALKFQGNQWRIKEDEAVFLKIYLTVTQRDRFRSVDLSGSDAKILMAGGVELENLARVQRVGDSCEGSTMTRACSTARRWKFYFFVAAITRHCGCSRDDGIL